MNKNGLILAAITATLISTPTLATNCEHIRGKIHNNPLANGGTLGVAKVRISNGTRLKCAVSGTPLAAVPGGPPINFEHRLVCNDHSEITLKTSGNFTSEPVICPSGSVSFSFLELSTPILDDPSKPQRGAFAGVSSGEITVKGSLTCDAEINMKFNGTICW